MLPRVCSVLRAIGTVMQVYLRLREGTQHTSRHHIMAEGRAPGMPAAGKRCRLWCVHMHVRSARSTRHAARILAERHAGCSEAYRLQHPTRGRIRCHHCSHGSMNSRLLVAQRLCLGGTGTRPHATGHGTRHYRGPLAAWRLAAERWRARRPGLASPRVRGGLPAGTLGAPRQARLRSSWKRTLWAAQQQRRAAECAQLAGAACKAVASDVRLRERFPARNGACRCVTGPQTPCGVRFVRGATKHVD